IAGLVRRMHHLVTDERAPPPTLIGIEEVHEPEPRRRRAEQASHHGASSFGAVHSGGHFAAYSTPLSPRARDTASGTMWVSRRTVHGGISRMTDHNDSRTGGQLVAACLRVHGVDTVFTVPGESFLAVLDGLHDLKNEIRLVVCRQEGGASYMAEAYGKLTG